MHTPHKKNAPGAEDRGASDKRLKLHVGCNSNEDSKTQADRQAFRHHVEALETFADQRDDLEARMDWAQLRLQLTGLDIDEQRALWAEGQQLIRVGEMLTPSRRAST